LFFRTVSPANTLVRWVDENAFASIVQARPCPTFGRPVHLGVAPIDYGPVLLLRPFGFHLAVDTLPSGVLPRKPTSSPLSRQRGITPAFGHGTPHPGARGTSTLLNNVLLSTHYGRSDSGPLRRGSARVISRFDRPTGSYTDRSPGFTLLAFGPFRLQPPAGASSRQGTLPVGGSDRDCIPLRVLLPTGTRGFAIIWQARRTTPAESSSLSYGRVVHLPLPPTMPHGVTSHCSEIAVTFGYKLR